MKQKYALVTGSSRGIGRALAAALVRAGYHVFINCRSSLAELAAVRTYLTETLGGSCTMVPGDVGDPTAVSDIFAAIQTHCDALDVLVNNAGISYVGLLSEMSDADWSATLQTNLSAVFYTCRAAIPGMVHQKAGRILNISSIWGHSGASCEVAYSASKAGVHGLTQGLAKELAPCHIPVNALSLGVVDTTMNDHLSAQEKQDLAAEIPAGRFATPGEAAAMALKILAAPEYLTGQIIRMDGGFL